MTYFSECPTIKWRVTILTQLPVRCGHCTLFSIVICTYFPFTQDDDKPEEAFRVSGIHIMSRRAEIKIREFIADSSVSKVIKHELPS